MYIKPNSNVLLSVPEWQLPIQEDEPPDSDPAIYERSTSESYHGNTNITRTPQKSTFDSTTAFSSGTKSRDRKNSSSLAANNLISLTKGSSSIDHISKSQPFSVTGSQHSNISKVVQPPPHSFQSAHLGHADMEMCSDEDDDTTKESQLDNFAYNKYDQRSATGALGTNPQHNANIPPLMTEEEFNKLKYGTPTSISIPPPIDRHAAPGTNSHNGIVPGMGPFSNPPPSFGDSSSHSSFSPMPTAQPTRVNPYLPTAPKELTKEEQEEERKTQSLQNRLRSLAGVPLETTPDENPSNSNPFSASKHQDSNSGNAYNYGGQSDSNRESFGSQYNEYRGGHMGGGQYNGPRPMLRSPMAGSWRGNPRHGTPMRGGRGMSRGRQGPRW